MKTEVECSQCSSLMEILSVKKYGGKWPIIFMISGVFCLLFLGGPILGIPLLLIGFYTLTENLTISYCPKCGHYFKIYLIEKDQKLT
ncbi:MAG: hypothetical protein HQK77_08055 [Desulfobacterales bacterium]|nr:hypothetical protein [Desulfobacterales bacterium]